MKLGENPVFSASVRSDKRCCSRRRLIACPRLVSDISAYGTKQHKDCRAGAVTYSADEHMIRLTGQFPRNNDTINILKLQPIALDTGYRKNMLPNLATFLHPAKAWQKLWKKFPVGELDIRIKYDIFDRPEYAYGVYHAARLARGTGVTRLSVIEFGVAGGAGLLALERIAEQVGRFFRIDIDVLGFDSGVGLPRPPDDYRDHPYLWDEGYFRMDENLLRSKLRSAKLILGDVA